VCKSSCVKQIGKTVEAAGAGHAVDPTTHSLECGASSMPAIPAKQLHRRVRPLLLRLLLHEHRLDIVEQLDLGAVLAHDDALLADRQRVVPGPVNHQSSREA